jgi:hypothetical protein
MQSVKLISSKCSNIDVCFAKLLGFSAKRTILSERVSKNPRFQESRAKIRSKFGFCFKALLNSLGFQAHTGVSKKQRLGQKFFARDAKIQFVKIQTL